MHCTFPENSLTPRQQEVSRVSAFHPGHLSGRTEDANYVSFQLQSHTPRVTKRHCLDAKLKHNLAGDLLCCITTSMSTTRSRNCTCKFSTVCRTVWMVDTWSCIATVTSTIRSMIHSFMMVFFALIIMLFDRKPSSSDTFILVTFTNSSGDQASISSASHKELMGVLKRIRYFFNSSHHIQVGSDMLPVSAKKCPLQSVVKAYGH